MLQSEIVAEEWAAPMSGFTAVVYFRLQGKRQSMLSFSCNMHARKINGHAKETGHSARLPVTLFSMQYANMNGVKLVLKARFIH